MSNDEYQQRNEWLENRLKEKLKSDTFQLLIKEEWFNPDKGPYYQLQNHLNIFFKDEHTQ